jgi:hypothetical protein
MIGAHNLTLTFLFFGFCYLDKLRKYTGDQQLLGNTA